LLKVGSVVRLGEMKATMNAEEVRAELAGLLREEASDWEPEAGQDDVLAATCILRAAEYRRAARLIESPMWGLSAETRATIAGRIVDDAEHARLINEPYVAKILFALADILKEPT
jgi:hypothetical protein